MFGIGTQELMLIFVIVMVLFGGSKLPDLAKSLGRSMNEFKKGLSTGGEEERPTTKTAPPPPPAERAPACAHCKATLETGWSHCPRCGTPVEQGPSRAA